MPTKFENFQKSLQAKKPKNQRGTGFNFSPVYVPQGQQTPGQKFDEGVQQRKQAGMEIFSTNRDKQTSRIATDVVNKSAHQIPTDEFGLVQKELTNFQPVFESRINAVSKRGNLALQTAEAKSEWHRLKNLQDLGQYAFTGSIQVNGTSIPGASANNPGAKAVALAMQAKRNNTPYVWGGNSLSRGVDCSGLVQQVYRQLGISVPRTTYQQAKHGKRVSINSLRPGDLVFYRGRDHVGLYMGNGKVVHAANSRLDIITSNLHNSNGSPTMAIRPY